MKGRGQESRGPGLAWYQWVEGMGSGGGLFSISRIQDLLTLGVGACGVWELQFSLVCLVAQGSLVEG